MQDLNHSIDLVHGVVEVEARAGCAGHTEPAHQRLVTMMPSPHGQPVLIRERGKIVRMRSVHRKSYERAALSGGPKNACARQFVETFGRVTRQLRVVFENR